MRKWLKCIRMRTESVFAFATNIETARSGQLPPANPTMSEADISMPTRTEIKGFPVAGTPQSTAPRLGAEALPFPVATTATAESLLQKVFSFPCMLATFLVGSVFAVGRAFSVDPDLWWHIKTGQIILNTHHWPTVDAYSFTVAGHPWIAGEWVGDVLIATVARQAGLQGLDALLIGLGSAVMVALYGYAALRSGNSKAGLVVAAVLLVLANASFSLRPQMFGYLFLVLTLVALERFRQGEPRGLYVLPVLFLVWVNTHGSFVIGIGTIAVFLLCGMFEFQLGGIQASRWTAHQRRQLEIVLLLSLIALTITPYGVQLALYPFHVAGSLPIGVANVAEWQSMPFGLFGGKFFLALVLGFFICQIVFRTAVRLEELVLLLSGIVMACLHVRFLLVFVPFFVPGFSTIIARWIPPYERAKDRYLLNGVLMTCLVAGIVHYFPAREAIQRKVASQFPVEAVEYLQTHQIPGPMFNSYGFGGYLVWADQKVFVDGRADPYERGGSLADYFYVTQLKPGALAVLRNYGIQSCLLDRDEPLVTLLSALPEWQRVYADNLSVLFVRRNSVTPARAFTGSPMSGQKE